MHKKHESKREAQFDLKERHWHDLNTVDADAGRAVRESSPDGTVEAAGEAVVAKAAEGAVGPRARAGLREQKMGSWFQGKTTTMKQKLGQGKDENANSIQNERWWTISGK